MDRLVMHFYENTVDQERLGSNLYAVAHTLPFAYKHLLDALQVDIFIGSKLNKNAGIVTLGRSDYANKRIEISTEALNDPDPGVPYRTLLEELTHYFDGHLSFSRWPLWKTAVSYDVRSIPARVLMTLERVYNSTPDSIMGITIPILTQKFLATAPHYQHHVEREWLIDLLLAESMFHSIENRADFFIPLKKTRREVELSNETIMAEFMKIYTHARGRLTKAQLTGFQSKPEYRSILSNLANLVRQPYPLSDDAVKHLMSDHFPYTYPHLTTFKEEMETIAWRHFVARENTEKIQEFLEDGISTKALRKIIASLTPENARQESLKTTLKATLQLFEVAAKADKELENKSAITEIVDQAYLKAVVNGMDIMQTAVDSGNYCVASRVKSVQQKTRIAKSVRK